MLNGDTKTAAAGMIERGAWSKPRLQIAEIRHTANAAGPDPDGGGGFQNGISPSGS